MRRQRAYDDELRLTRGTTETGGRSGTDTGTFTLDAVANRTAHSRVSGGWVYDANNRLVQRGTGDNAITYQYDDAGNLTRTSEPGAKVTAYEYDAQNRLIEVRDGSGRPMARYGYDPLHRRVWKEQYVDPDRRALAVPKRTHYLYADEGLIAETSQDLQLEADASVTVKSNPSLTAQYGPRPNADFTTGILFVKTKNSKGQDSIAYYHHDHLGTPIQASDKAGQVVWAARYNAFGRAEILTPESTGHQPTITSQLRLPGQIEDAETGLHYNYRRYYDSGSGRYVQSDPIGIAGGINAYWYADGNPLWYVDPTGEVGVVGAGVGAILEIGIQAVKNYRNGCDVFDFGNYDWYNVGISAAVGAIAPGWLTVGRTSINSGRAIRKLSEQLGRARTANRSAKIESRIQSHATSIADQLVPQLGFQGIKAIGQKITGAGSANDCTCRP